VRCFILAAGFGTRLLPLTDHVPKALVPLCGIPLLKRTYDFLRANGITCIALNSHHHPEQVEQFVKNNCPDVQIFCEQAMIRGTGGALVFAREFLSSDDSFCVANVDIVTDVDLGRLAKRFLQSSAVVGLVAAPSESGTIRYDADTGEFAGTRRQQERGDQTRVPAPDKSADFIGITFYRKEFISMLLDDDFDIVPVWGRAQRRGMKVTVLETGPAYWNDVGTAGNLAKVHFDVLDGTIELSAPGTIVVDKKEKKAYPASFSKRSLTNIGPYTWMDASEIPEETTFSRAVVFPDAVVPDGVHIENAIVTKYGVMSFEQRK
jgi:NDP-sugar pyrophosphorylase family protein